METVSHTIQVGTVRSPEDAALPRPGDVARRSMTIRCAASMAPPSAEMVAEVDRARGDGDTSSGVVEVLVYGVPPGLGSYVQWDRRIDARLAEH